MSKKSEPKKRTLPSKSEKKELTLKENHFKILLLKSQLTPDSKIAKILKIAKSTLHGHILRLTRDGYLNDQKELTKKGKQASSLFLRGCENGMPREIKIRAHDLCFKVKIVRFGSLYDRINELGNWTEVVLKNWRKYTREFHDGVKVHVTPKSVLFYLPEIIESNPEAAFNQALDMVFNHKKAMENQVEGLVLGEPECVVNVVSNHLAFELDPFARLCAGHNITFKSDRFHVDHSNGTPELEGVHKDLARDDMRTIFDFYHELVNGDYDKARALILDKGITILDVLKALFNRIKKQDEKLDDIVYFLGLKPLPHNQTTLEKGDLDE